jgi:hypothetical protein
MKRFALSLPVVLVGLPLLGCLILAQSRPQGAAKVAVADDASFAAVDKPAEKPAPTTDKLPTNAEMEELLRKNPMAFLENTLEKYRREVKAGYHLTLWKHEVIDGKDLPNELIDVYYREKPYSVYFSWQEGATKAKKLLYVEGENKDSKGKSQMLVQPNGAFLSKFVVSRDPRGSDAKASAHYPLDDFGFYNNQTRTLKAWQTNFKRGTQKVEYLGMKKVKELDDRLCFSFRAVTTTPVADGVAELTSYFDAETWFQTGSIIKDKDGKLMGEYYFRAVQLNPEFKPDQFTREGLK